MGTTGIQSMRSARGRRWMSALIYLLYDLSACSVRIGGQDRRVIDIETCINIMATGLQLEKSKVSRATNSFSLCTHLWSEASKNERVYPCFHTQGKVRCFRRENATVDHSRSQ